MPAERVLEVRGLSVDYDSPDGALRAVDAVDLSIDRRSFVSVVGESGCGKSTMLFAIAQLLSPPAFVSEGSVQFLGNDLVALTSRELNALRWKNLSVVMQSAMNALNPVMSIGAQFRDALVAHGTVNRAEITERSGAVMKLVGIDPYHLRSYPHQLSGGMRQRAMIAMALLFTPDLIIMDEPTSALDVVAQRSLMVQIRNLQEELGFAVLFVTHDMALVSQFSDQLVVMYAGQVVESGPTREVFQHPKHPYTRGLMGAYPSISRPRTRLEGIPGRPPELTDMPSGCRFLPRCDQAVASCATAAPQLLTIGPSRVRCPVQHSSPDGPELRPGAVARS